MSHQNISKTQPEESPPVKISHGSGSLATLAAIAGTFIPLLIAALTDERLNKTMQLALLICGTVLVVAYMGFRSWQATVAERNRR